MSIIKVGKEEVNLDDEILKFTPETINDFLTTYASLYHYYQSKHNDATYIAKKLSDNHSSAIHAKFKKAKEENGYSDRMAEACAKSDPECTAMLDKVRAAEYAKDELWGFLRSMDYAHADAKEMCYNLRKELDKIYPKTISRLDEQPFTD